MSEETKPKFELPWGTLLPVLAALAGLIVQFRPLVTTRPAVAAEKAMPVIALEDVDARFWQDPIAAAQTPIGAPRRYERGGGAERSRPIARHQHSGVAHPAASADGSSSSE